MRILAKYKNGNYEVTLYEDGTKVKHTEEDSFIASFPDSIDLKITDYCENNCPMCHENSSIKGRHGDLSHPIVDTFPTGMEVAIGGGDPLSHPDLLAFLEKLKAKGIIANLTVNALDLKKQRTLLDRLIEERLIHGLGVSCMAYDEYAVDFALKHPNVVLHLINGVFLPEDYEKLYGKGLKILILGYKVFGKGKSFYSPAVRDRMRENKALLPVILKGFKVISFDNLALEQLDVRGVIGEERFREIYMGEDGDASMYVDLVKKEYSLSSSSEERCMIAGSLRECFHELRKKKE